MKTYLEIEKKKSAFLAICQYLGSLKLAVFLIAILGIILTCSTFYESLQSTELVQRFVYTNVWFDLYLTLFALNVFCAVILRYPFKKRHTGFVVTHLGILIICLGAVMDRHFGIEGQMFMREGAVLDTITLRNRVVELEANSGDTFRISADPLLPQRIIGKRTAVGKNGLFWTLLGYEPKLSQQLKIEDSGTAVGSGGKGADLGGGGGGVRQSPA